MENDDESPLLKKDLSRNRANDDDDDIAESNEDGTGGGNGNAEAEYRFGRDYNGNQGHRGGGDDVKAEKRAASAMMAADSATEKRDSIKREKFEH